MHKAFVFHQLPVSPFLQNDVENMPSMLSFLFHWADWKSHFKHSLKVTAQVAKTCCQRPRGKKLSLEETCIRGSLSRRHRRPCLTDVGFKDCHKSYRSRSMVPRGWSLPTLVIPDYLSRATMSYLYFFTSKYTNNYLMSSAEICYSYPWSQRINPNNWSDEYNITAPTGWIY